MTIEDDEQLLNSLGAMFASELAHRPSDAERDAFLNVVAEQPAADERDDGTVVVPFERPARRWGRRVAVGGASVVVAISGLTAVAAAANNGVLPTPARAVLHAVGVPVDSVELAKAKDALRRLRGADDAELPQAIDRFERSLSGLSYGELSDVERSATHVLEDARSRRGSGSGGGSCGSGGDDGLSGTSIATQSPTGSTSATSDDRGRGGSGRGSSDSGSPTASVDDGTHGGSSPSIVDKSGSGDSSGNGSDNGGGSGSRGTGGGSGGGGSDDGVAATTPSASVGSSTPATDDGHRDDGTTATTESSHSTTATTASTSGTTATTDDHGGGSGGSGSGGGGSGGTSKKP